MTQSLRLPPHSHEAEAHLLGAIMANNRSYFDACSILSADHFADDRHGRIYEVCGKLIERAHTANATTLKSYFEQDASLAEIGGTPYLAKLIHVHNPGQVKEQLG